MKKNKFVFRSTTLSIFLSFIFGGIFIISNPQNTFAYDNDTHFWLTYYLAIKAGYTHIDATQIASANVSVDFDEDTVPLLADFDDWKDVFQPLSHWQTVVNTYHAMPMNWEVNAEAGIDNLWWDPTVETRPEVQSKSIALVKERQNEFWNETLKHESNPGVFLHYSQDAYAHRHFKSWLGHAGYFYVDFLSSNPKKAQEMAIDTLKYLIIFRKYKTQQLEPPDKLHINFFVERNDISMKDLDDIKRIVVRFVEDNPVYVDPKSHWKPVTVDGGTYYQNPLIKSWVNTSEKKQRSLYKLFPLKYIIDAYYIKRKQPVPNSYKARLAVKEFLGVTDDNQLPDIWRFDLVNSGMKSYVNRKKPCAEKAYVYKKNYDLGKYEKKKPHLAKHEEANKKLEKKSYSNNISCLPFDLADNSSSTSR